MTNDQLIDYLLNKTIPSDLTTREESYIVSEIFKNCWDNTPENLYRYRACNEYSFDALENDKFLLTKPTMFNDPYDSLLFVDKQALIDIITNSENKDSSLIDRLNNDLEFRNSQIELLGQEFVSYHLQSPGFKDSQEEAFFNELSDKIHTKLIDNITEESIKSLKQSSLVGCLSENINSVLMWSHYAQNHQGFALNYNFKARYSIETGIPGVKATEFADKKLFPVKYIDERYDATSYLEFNFLYNIHLQLGIKFNQPFFDKLFYYKYLLFKSTDWSYEKEWRIIKQTNLNYDDGKSNFDFIENICPKEIYLGAHITEENKEKLLVIAKSKKIDVFQMKIDYFSKYYKLSKDKIIFD